MTFQASKVKYYKIVNSSGQPFRVSMTLGCGDEGKNMRDKATYSLGGDTHVPCTIALHRDHDKDKVTEVSGFAVFVKFFIVVVWFSSNIFGSCNLNTEIIQHSYFIYE